MIIIMATKITITPYRDNTLGSPEDRLPQRSLEKSFIVVSTVGTTTNISIIHIMLNGSNDIDNNSSRTS